MKAVKRGWPLRQKRLLLAAHKVNCVGVEVDHNAIVNLQPLANAGTMDANEKGCRRRSNVQQIAVARRKDQLSCRFVHTLWSIPRQHRDVDEVVLKRLQQLDQRVTADMKQCVRAADQGDFVLQQSCKDDGRTMSAETNSRMALARTVEICGDDVVRTECVKQQRNLQERQRWWVLAELAAGWPEHVYQSCRKRQSMCRRQRQRDNGVGFEF